MPWCLVQFVQIFTHLVFSSCLFCVRSSCLQLFWTPGHQGDISKATSNESIESRRKYLQGRRLESQMFCRSALAPSPGLEYLRMISRWISSEATFLMVSWGWIPAAKWIRVLCLKGDRHPLSFMGKKCIYIVGAISILTLIAPQQPRSCQTTLPATVLQPVRHPAMQVPIDNCHFARLQGLSIHVTYANADLSIYLYFN